MIEDTADLSLISFLKIISGINKKVLILDYQNHEQLKKRIPNYKVKMGLGLHVGWAIEGAIGSQYKIDASYLSPNVNMASRLEAATKQYGVPLLISNNLFEILSEKVQFICREIDRVTVKGSKNPVGIFTVDIELENLPVSSVKHLNKEDRNIKHRVNKEIIMDGLYENKFRAFDFFEDDEDLKIIIVYNELFRNVFDFAFKKYIEGKWEESREKLEECLNILKNDGPGLVLLNFIEKFNFKSPDDWKGFRELTEK